MNKTIYMHFDDTLALTARIGYQWAPAGRAGAWPWDSTLTGLTVTVDGASRISALLEGSVWQLCSAPHAAPHGYAAPDAWPCVGDGSSVTRAT